MSSVKRLLQQKSEKEAKARSTAFPNIETLNGFTDSWNNVCGGSPYSSAGSGEVSFYKIEQLFYSSLKYFGSEKNKFDDLYYNTIGYEL